MKLFPAIDIINGKCVRLKQGDYKKVKTYINDPIDVAKKWEELGGDMIHLVDLDGAKCGKTINEDVIKMIVKNVLIDVELGGGIRSMEDIEKKLDLGIKRVIIGSKAIDLNFVKDAISIFGNDKIVVGIDAKDGYVAINGWQKVTSNKANDLCKELERIGVKTVIYTDIAKDGMLEGPNIAETKRIIDDTNLEVVASGGISSLEDLLKLKKIGVHGAILGRSLYEGLIRLDEAKRILETN